MCDAEVPRGEDKPGWPGRGAIKELFRVKMGGKIRSRRQMREIKRDYFIDVKLTGW